MLRPLLLAAVLAVGCSESPVSEDAGVDADVEDAAMDAAPVTDSWVWDPDSGCLDNAQTLACPFESTGEVPYETSEGDATMRTTTTSARVFLCPGVWRVRRCSPTTTSVTVDGGSSSQTTDDCEEHTSPGGDTYAVCSETRTYEVNGELRWEHSKTWETVRVEH